MHINKNKTRATKKVDICLVQDEFACFSAIASRQLNVLLCYGSWHSVLLLIAEQICFAWGSRSYQ